MISILVIYINLIIKVKIYFNAKVINLAILNAENNLLYFYNIISLYRNFININKNDFNKLIYYYYNNNKKVKIKFIKIFKTYFISLDTLLLKIIKNKN